MGIAHAVSPPPASQKGLQVFCFFVFCFSDFSFTLLAADTDRLKAREKSRAVKVMFYDNVFEADGTFPGAP